MLGVTNCKSSGIARGAFYKYFDDDLTDAYEYVYQLVMKDHTA